MPEKVDAWCDGLCSWYSPSPVAVPLYMTMRELTSEGPTCSICAGRRSAGKVERRGGKACSAPGDVWRRPNQAGASSPHSKSHLYREVWECRSEVMQVVLHSRDAHSRVRRVLYKRGRGATCRPEAEPGTLQPDACWAAASRLSLGGAVPIPADCERGSFHASQGRNPCR